VQVVHRVVLVHQVVQEQVELHLTLLQQYPPMDWQQILPPQSMMWVT
jgi:hypothetical protein